MIEKQLLIAIHPDDEGPRNSSAPRWRAHLEAANCAVRIVDARRSDILDQVQGSDGFMWRYNHGSADRQVARRLFPVLERELGILCYPNQNTCWHFDDKIAQHLLFNAHHIPQPRTHVFYERDEAMAFLRDASFPLVLKLAGGAGASNVRLVDNAAQGRAIVERLFSRGLVLLSPNSIVPGSIGDARKRMLDVARTLGLLQQHHALNWDVHRGYVLFQEFLPDNAFDTRVTVIGNRAFAYRRFNRPNDFRASGSGNFSPEPAHIDLETVRLAFEVARKLRTQSVAIDGLLRGNDRVVGEISYSYVSWMVQSCPGQWDSNLNWHSGQMWPEQAQATDFLLALSARAKKHAAPTSENTDSGRAAEDS
jgi:hypothetical protein